MKKVAINKCFGGFSLSDEAYERLIELGVPVQAYVKEKMGEDGLYLPEPKNEGKVIFDNDLSERDIPSFGRYWETWISNDRSNPLLIQVIEELGSKANGSCSELKIVEVPDDVDFTIEEYDGMEHIA